ncbi:hypothetical protein [Dubosiella newyorkensis]|uniref:hypothetical protein n=1 Tax=Dubosiella newyorkensis TaxID=1862672 RepID=UPI003F680E7F
MAEEIIDENDQLDHVKGASNICLPERRAEQLQWTRSLPMTNSLCRKTIEILRLGKNNDGCFPGSPSGARLAECSNSIVESAKQMG